MNIGNVSNSSTSKAEVQQNFSNRGLLTPAPKQYDERQFINVVMNVNTDASRPKTCNAHLEKKHPQTRHYKLTLGSPVTGTTINFFREVKRKTPPTIKFQLIWDGNIQHGSVDAFVRILTKICAWKRSLLLNRTPLTKEAKDKGSHIMNSMKCVLVIRSLIEK